MVTYPKKNQIAIVVGIMACVFCYFGFGLGVHMESWFLGWGFFFSSILSTILTAILIASGEQIDLDGGPHEY